MSWNKESPLEKSNFLSSQMVSHSFSPSSLPLYKAKWVQLNGKTLQVLKTSLYASLCFETYLDQLRSCCSNLVDLNLGRNCSNMYWPYSVQSKKTANQVYIYFTVLGAAIKCKQLCSLLILTFPKTGKYDDWKIFCWFFGRFEDTNATFHKKGP